MQGRRLGVITPPSGRFLEMAILNSAGRFTGEVCSGLRNESLQNFEAEVNNKRKFSILSLCKMCS